MKTFKEYQYQTVCCDPDKLDWDEPIIEGSEEWLDAIEGEDIQEVQKGSVSFLGLGFSALTGTLPLYLKYKIATKHIQAQKAGCGKETSIKARNECLYNFRKKGFEAKIKLLSKVKSKEENPKKIKKIDKQIGEVKKKMGELRVKF